MKGSELLVNGAIGGGVLAAVLALSAGGLLQGLDLTLHDQYVRYAIAGTGPSSRVLILEITERDIEEQGHWPLSDHTLSRTLRLLLDAGARVVGLDLYRNLPVPPGELQLTELLAREPRILAVEKFSDEHSQGIPGPPVLVGTERIGFNDILVDRDGTVRRGLVFLDDGGDRFGSSFAYRLALAYLEAEGIGANGDPQHPDWLRLGSATLPPFEGTDGGYAGEDAAGYQFLLDFADGGRPFESITLGPLLRGEVDPARIRDRIILVGATAESLPDFYNVPYLRGVEAGIGIPGVAIHGHIVSQLVRLGLGESRPVRVLHDGLEALVSAIFVVLGCALAVRVRAVYVVAPTGLLGLVGLWGLGALALRGGIWLPVAAPALGWALGSGLMLAWSSSRERTERALLMQLFSRHVSPQVAEQVWRQRDAFLSDGRPRPQRLDATVLFLDMRGYTARAEKMEPEELMAWVSDFMDAMAQTVVSHDGVVDDYFGDGLKANFGVPFPRTTAEEVARDARRAVSCALAMREVLGRVNADYRAQSRPQVAMRVGVHTGVVVAGSMGSAGRLKYTVVGDVVVTAQRLESLDAIQHDYGVEPCRILISGETQRRLGGEFRTEALGRFSLKGRSEALDVHRVLGGPA